MSAIKAGGGSEGMKPVAVVVGIILLILALGVVYYLSPGVAFMGLLGVVIGGLLIGFGVHFVPVGGAPAAMGQSPGIATGVTMLAAGAGLAGLFGGAWAAEYGLAVALAGGAIGGGLMMAITCLMVNIIYVYAMGIPAASGKVAKDPITGDTFEAYKSQGTEGHGLPFISYVGGVIGGILGGLGGTLIYLELLEVYETFLPTLLNASPDEVKALAVGLAGIFAIGMFLVNAVIAAYNITGTIEGPHDPKFKRFPRAVIGCAVASAVCGVLAIFVVLV
ncbi:MAG: tetrahydromethanopterin S-methyltransferase subunit D [Methanomicrobium sp.]|jgi:tetrahydromethanopterin S-methyltransferase subunit D|uniref:tetrahydromethanopterin S-methyltransferase subunit D n=1 Tax=Methanomicrobium mobile TaxID=2205 RepID=UPI0005B2BEFE|nr:tetrahydromethanopterin S-methyltransferase subunit D [Methanomicrobium mobile]MBP5083154.1 tetrahydromethanopterin S-methyltransferase subunit D [Methanomicrobium sp.]MBP5475071.1 tetrahydromethanopterin S-methyltransferase subunit D [Methanomicrobium sp.]